MKCIYCSNRKTEVTNSREAQAGMATWRRRRCPSCHHIFTTTENALAHNLFVIKRNGSRQRFVYEKLFVSLFTILNSKKGSDHGDDTKLAKKISENIVKQMVAITSRERNIPTSAIIALAYRQLKKVSAIYADHYVHYSPYRQHVAQQAGLVRMY